MRRPTTRMLGCAALGLLALAASACGSTSGSADGVGSLSATDSPGPMTRLISLDFDDAQIDGNSIRTTNKGAFSVRTWVTSAGDGEVVVKDGADGNRYLQLPALSSAAVPSRAVLVVTARLSSDGNDRLSPGKRDFAFGARFRLDASSSNGKLDNGNNVVQRGLSADPSQYKIQVDHDRISCLVAGNEGVLLVTSRHRVESEEWYSAQCERTGDTLTLVSSEEGEPREEVTATGPTGRVSSEPTAPFAVGGKVAPTGEAVRGDSDQFNGGVDDVFLSVAPPD